MCLLPERQFTGIVTLLIVVGAADYSVVNGHWSNVGYHASTTATTGLASVSAPDTCKFLLGSLGMSHAILQDVTNRSK